MTNKNVVYLKTFVVSFFIVVGLCVYFISRNRTKDTFLEKINTKEQLVEAMRDSVVRSYFVNGAPVVGDCIEDTIEEIIYGSPLIYLQVTNSIFCAACSTIDSLQWKVAGSQHYYSKNVHLFDTLEFSFFHAQIYGRCDNNFSQYVAPSYKSSFKNGECNLDKINKKTFHYFKNGDTLYFQAKIGRGTIVPDGSFAYKPSESFLSWLFPMLFIILGIAMIAVSFALINYYFRED
ncbi:MAG: hypothetical protein IKQ46_04425 [Bacteroidales bacterium]|nr:hypothetical protein [Bacteroidales bacterium]